MNFQISEKLQKLPPYLFAEIDVAKQKAIKEGKKVIDLGVGDPDLPTPDFIIESFKNSLNDTSTHKYPSVKGLKELRNVISRWVNKRFNLDIDLEDEILPLIGSKEGIANFPLAFINNKDLVLVPDPCYPPYIGGSILSGADVYKIPLREENNFLPDLSKIPNEISNKAKIIFINYPNNPTGAIAGLDFFSDVVKFARKYNIIVVHDAAYSEISFGGYKPSSFLEVEGAKEVGIEFHSLSKTFNMTGWRIGWAMGNASLIKGLTRVKSNIDSGIFQAVQKAGITALSDQRGKEHIKQVQSIYSKRQDLVVKGLESIGWKVMQTKATFYLWCKIPGNMKSADYSKYLLDKTAVVVTPGVGLGESGEGYIRISLTSPEEELKSAIKRLEKTFS